VASVPAVAAGQVSFGAVGAGTNTLVRTRSPFVQSRIDDGFNAYDPAFAGGVRVAAGDINGDGVPDIVTAPGPGAAPVVRVFDGRSHALIREFMGSEPDFTGGLFVAVGDVDGDGFGDIIVGVDFGREPLVRVFSGWSGAVIRRFVAYAAGFRGGVHVAAGDMNADGYADIICGAGPGGGPHVVAFSGADLSLLASFYAYAPEFAGGVWVAAGDVDGDGRAEIVNTIPCSPPACGSRSPTWATTATVAGERATAEPTSSPLPAPAADRASGSGTSVSSCAPQERPRCSTDSTRTTRRFPAESSCRRRVP
jgi:hypothetical protein